jgi:MATE family multidrug resistance protein
MAGGVVAVMLAGHLNADVLGAVAVGNSIWNLALMALVGVMMAVSPSVAHLDGARRHDETAALFVQAAWIAVVLGAVLGMAVFRAGPALADLAGIDPALHAGVRGFLRAVGPGAPAVGLFLACRGLCDGLSRTHVSMGFALLGLAVLAPLGWVLMYGRFGFPALGAEGAGIATAAMCWVQSLAFLAWLRLSPATAGLGWAGLRLAPDPAAIAVLLEVGMFSTAALLIARFGPAAVAGHQIAMNVAALCFMVPLGLGMAITVRVGNAVGRADPAGVRRAVTAGLALVLVTQAISCSLLLSLPRAIAALYTTDPAVLDAAAGLLLLAAIFQFSDGIQVAAAGALRGLKDTRVPMLITAVSYWGVGMPAGLYFAFAAGLRTPGLWIGLIAGLTVAAVLLSTRLHRRTVLRG